MTVSTARSAQEGRNGAWTRWWAAWRANLPLLLLVAAAAVLRLQGLDWDEGNHLHPDERFMTMVAADVRLPASVAEYFDTPRSPLNPANAGHGFFVYGTLPLFLVKAAASVIGWGNYDHVYLVGRAISALFAIGTVLLTYRLALLLAGPAAALGAAALMTFSVTAIQQAHYFTVDSFGAFFATASLVALARVAAGHGLSSHLLFGAAFAMMLACRINLAILGPLYPVAVLYAWGYRGARPRRLLAWAAATAVVAAVVFRVLQPYAFAGPGFLSFSPAPAFLQSMASIRAFATGEADFPPSVQWIGRMPVLSPGWNLLVWALGPPWGLAVLGALPWFLLGRAGARDGGEQAGPARIVLLWVPVLFLFHATQFAATIRYFLPIVPVLAVAVAWWLTAPPGPLPHGASRIRRAALLAVVLLTALWALAFTSIYRAPHTRVEASRWIYEHVQPGATIATEHWDDGLPLGLGHDVGALYKRLELRLYDDENEGKRTHLLETLDAANVVVLSSNRLYRSIPRAPWRYPLARRYYELLFSGGLGFRLDRVFVSRPRIAGIEIADDEAEEAFTVYDHPKVLVFRKTAEYSSERAAALLGAVSLSGIVRASPRDGTALYRRTRPEPIPLPGEDARRAVVGSRAPGSFEALARWLLAFEVLSLACFALLLRPLAATRDRGYGFAKLVAWLAPGTVVWWLAGSGLAPNGLTTARVTAAALIAAGAAAAWRSRADLRQFWRTDARTLFLVEGVFLGTFAIFLSARALVPAVYWGEKPMDFAILNACLRAVTFPPADPWFAGEPLNYFYFGHAVTAVFANVAGVEAAFAFNLALATIGALLAVVVCVLAAQVLTRGSAGVIAALLVVLAGNLAGPRAFLLGPPPSIGFDYFWATSRVVPGTINEYPLWNLLFGDLHAHVLAMPLQAGLLYLGTLWLVGAAPPARVGRWFLSIMSAWVLGAIAVTSSWSLPTGMVLQLAFLVTAWLYGRRRLAALAGAVATWAAIVVASHVLFRPFWSHYAPPDRHWGWITSESAPPWDVVTIFGIFVALALPALAASVARWTRLRPWRIALAVAALALAASLGSLRSPACALFAACAALGLLAWLMDERPAVRIGGLLFGAAGGLGTITEIVFVWDRMNTVFKYYLEMWLMLGTAGGVLAWSLRERLRGTWRLGITGFLVLVTAAGLFTTVTALAGFVRGPVITSRIPTLDGWAYLETESRGELEAYRWIAREVRGIPVVLEAQGPPYQAFTRVSMNTGLPTVLGWEYHLVQQGRPRAQIEGRAADVREMYETTDLAAAEQLLRRYHVDFVFVGPLERRTYAAAGLAKFDRSALLQRVFTNSLVTIYATAGRAQSVKSWIAPVPPAAPRLPHAAPLREPRAVAAAPDGTMVVADFGNRRVQRLSPALEPLAAFGREGNAPGEFRDPCGIAVGADGTVWVADTWNHRIQKFSSDGQPLAEWHAQLYGPRGVALGADGSVYVTDTGNHRVVRFDPDGAPHVFVEGSGLDDPIGIAVDARGDVYVASTKRRQIAVFAPDGQPRRQWSVNGWEPGSRVEPYIAVGPDGVVWVTDPTGRRVLLFEADGRPLGEGVPSEPLQWPLGIAVLGRDRAVVTDAVMSRVVEVRRPGLTIQEPGGGSGDPPATGAGRRLQTPTRKSPAR